MENVTELELQALKAIFKNSDGGDGRTLDALENDNCSWFNTSDLAENCDWSLDRAKGVISSLLSKRLIGEDVLDDLVRLKNGKMVWKESNIFFLSYGKGFETLRNLGITTIDDC